MRITIVQGAFLPVPATRGGAIEKAFHALAKEFAAADHRVDYISRLCDDLPRQESESPNLRHIRIKGYDAPRSLPKLKWLDLLYSLRARRILPEADILVTHTFWLPILARNDRHGKLYVHVGRSPKGQMKFYRHAARLQTVSSPIVRRIHQELPPKAHGLANRLPYPLDPAFLKPADHQSPRDKTILFAGRIHPEKGLDLLICAYRNLPEQIQHQWKLKILGPWRKEHGGAGSPYMESLRKLAEGTDIQFMEPIFDQQLLVQEYDKASIFAYPSLAEQGETFGLAALEAMSRGCLTLVSELDCFKDFIAHGDNGFIFNHRDTNPTTVLARHLSRLLETPEDLRPVAEKAIATAQAYSPASVGKAFIKDFECLLQTP